MSASKSIWARDTATAVEAVVIGIGLTGYRDLVNGSIGDNRVALTLELGLSYRSLIGDVAARDSLREALLGTRSSTFYGFEGGMQIRFNKIVAGVQLYHLWDLTRGKRVDGLTRGQMVAGFSVQGDVFTGTLTGKR
jgi:hypothetical protein